MRTRGCVNQKRYSMDAAVRFDHEPGRQRFVLVTAGARPPRCANNARAA
jgi:hypothetical protein